MEETNMEQATEKQKSWIQKNRADLWKDGMSKGDAYKIISEALKSTESKEVNDWQLAMCFKLGKKYNQDPIGLYQEYNKLKTKLEGI